ncbi:hypothetical protein BDZ89DRAFT_1090857 [Hymenopellis radicata]|nr:hypothetical protein BDZ89DRAFT_1090857 [Hymenopellis radicata]
MHKIPLTPTADTLSLYVVDMSFEIDPKSVGTYLSGICNKLEDFFPEVRATRKSRLVAQTLAGCKRWRGKPVQRKQPLSRAHLERALTSLSPSSSHDDVLFVAMLHTGFGALLRLGEMTQPDNARLRNPRKLAKRISLFQVQNGFGFILPYHKADRLFEGNNIIVTKRGGFDPLPIFYHYLASRDTSFPFHPMLWVKADGTVPNRRWFIARLRILEPDRTFAGQSLRAGGATALAEDGVTPHLIQAAGRWKNPMLLEAAIYANRHIAN